MLDVVSVKAGKPGTSEAFRDSSRTAEQIKRGERECLNAAVRRDKSREEKTNASLPAETAETEEAVAGEKPVQLCTRGERAVSCW